MTSFNERLRAAMLSDAEAAENKRLRAAPATAPEFPADWAQMIHYPECWDTAAYPELRDAIHEALAWSGCSVCKPSTAPAWKAATAAALERAAEVCQQISALQLREECIRTADSCAEAIRALKDES